MRLLKTTEYGECDEWLDEIGMDNAYDESGKPYWSPEYSIEFTELEAACLSQAATSVYSLMLRTFERWYRNDDFYRSLGIESEEASLIVRSWQQADPSLIGRFDFGLNESGEVRLYEYNIDPLGMQMASSLAQEAWFAFVCARGRLAPRAYQHADFRREMSLALARTARPGTPLYILTQVDNPSVRANARALEVCALMAGIEARRCEIDGIRSDGQGRLLDPGGQPIEQSMRLANWERIRELCGSGPHPALWFDPPWTRVFGNKAFLHYLWREEPRNPSLLPTHFRDSPALRESQSQWVYKPSLGVQGRGVRVLDSGMPVFTDSPGEVAVWQEYFPSRLEGLALTVSVWVIGGKPVRSLAVRARRGEIVDEGSIFLPHSIVRSP